MTSTPPPGQCFEILPVRLFFRLCVCSFVRLFVPVSFHLFVRLFFRASGAGPGLVGCALAYRILLKHVLEHHLVEMHSNKKINTHKIHKNQIRDEKMLPNRVLKRRSLGFQNVVTVFDFVCKLTYGKVFIFD